MSRYDLLERAKRSHRLAVLHRGLRDVSREVADVRESLSAAGASPATIDTTEDELSALVRDGLLAEARITFELAADQGSTPAERDFLFSDLVALVTKAVQSGSRAAERPIGDEEAARVLDAHDPSKGLVPWDQARQSGEFAGVSDKDIDALNFDAIDAEPPAVGAHRLPDDDPGPFIEIDPDDDEDDGYPVITVETVSIAPECLMPDADDGDVMSPESVRMAIRFFGQETAAELGCIPAPAQSPLLLTKVIRPGTIPPPLP
ncbi:MAG TPA: hypothetical protein VLC10_03095, partial [Patescibacteria group bacterium]|nr:hypothetical protein [Patescibacteria group bacterium]